MNGREFESRFTYHAPTSDQPERYEAVRSEARSFAMVLDSFVPESREKALAFTKLEEAIFWANAGVARNPQEYADDDTFMTTGMAALEAARRTTTTSSNPDTSPTSTLAASGSTAYSRPETTTSPDRQTPLGQVSV